jgi:hypothetical protein
MWYSNVLVELFQVEKSYLSGFTSLEKPLLSLQFVSNLFGTGKLQLFQPNPTGYYLLNLQDCAGRGYQAIC